MDIPEIFNQEIELGFILFVHTFYTDVANQEVQTIIAEYLYESTNEEVYKDVWAKSYEMFNDNEGWDDLFNKVRNKGSLISNEKLIIVLNVIEKINATENSPEKNSKKLKVPELIRYIISSKIEKLADGKLKIPINESNFTLWEVEFEISMSYDKENYTFEEAQNDFLSKVGTSPIEEEEDSYETEINLSTEIQYYACDSGDGGNIINDCLNALRDDTPGFNDIDYEYRWKKLDYKDFLDEPFIEWALEISSYGEIIHKDGFLIGYDLSLVLNE
jgi:hypothetical protein